MKLFKPKCFEEAKKILDFCIDEEMLPKGKNRTDDDAINLLQEWLLEIRDLKFQK